MSLIIPHNLTIQRHAAIPYLWRVRCSCRYEAICGSEEAANLCKASHLSEEEAFPDYSFLSEEPPK